MSERFPEGMHRACDCGTMHIKQYHNLPHQHSLAGTQPICDAGCCILDGCQCRKYVGRNWPGKLTTRRLVLVTL